MKIETKFNVGNEVWFIHNNVPQSLEIGFITVTIENGYCVEYTFRLGADTKRVLYLREDEVFSTKEELINSL